MARIRSVHPALHRDKTLSRASANAERTFVRLWCHLDDEGRGEDDVELFKSDLYPRHRDMDEDAIEVDLQELAELGLVIRYVVGGERYLTCKPSTWKQYQRPQKKQESKLPGPDQSDPETDLTDTDTDPVHDRSHTGPRPVSPVGEGRGEGVVGELDAGIPVSAETGRSLAATIADWIENQGLQPPDTGHLVDDFRWVADALEKQADPGPRKDAARVRLAREFVEQATGEDMEPSAIKQLTRVVSTTQHLGTIVRGLNEAVRRGAGLDPEHQSPRAIVKYAVAVLNGERGAA